jgi:DNA-binding Lrp family transcriptional regulator
MSAPQLDDLDRQLIAILSHDARISNRKIASELGVTEGTVRGRIKRLQQDRLIAFTAITSFGMERSTKLAFVGVQAEVENINRIARDVADLADVSGVLITLGRFNILAMCLFSDLEDLHHIASDQILAISGVHHVETSIAVKTIKYNARVVKITETDHSIENGD